MRYVPDYVKSTGRKQKVYFTCHPNDKKYFETISETIISLREECVIWWEDDDLIIHDEEFLNQSIKEMHLIVIPITKDFLFENSQARDVDFKYAKDNNIPLLLWMEERGLSEVFCAVCGKLQFLNPFDTDSTTISYQDKLKKFLSHTLIGDGELEEIRSAFAGHMFLSYRKQDIKQAQKLMEQIHSCEKCREWAIWYDEFLTVGENFNDEIKTWLKASDLFAIVVTPNLLEAGNYIQKIEYPLAQEYGKIIFPAETVLTDKKELGDKFPGILDYISDSNVEEKFFADLYKTIEKADTIEVEMTAERAYKLGQAYLKGIDVERNPSIGMEFLKKSAEQNYQNAYTDLVHIYSNGLYIDKDIEKAIHWQKIYIECLEKDSLHNSGLKFHRYLKACRKLVELYYCLSDTKKILGEKQKLENFLYIDDYKDYITEIKTEIAFDLYTVGKIYKSIPALEDARKVLSDALYICTEAYNESGYSCKPVSKNKSDKCPLKRNSHLGGLDARDALVLMMLEKIYEESGNIGELTHDEEIAQSSYLEILAIVQEYEVFPEEGANWNMIDSYLKQGNFYVKSLFFDETDNAQALHCAEHYFGHGMKKIMELDEYTEDELDEIEDIDYFMQKKEYYSLRYYFCIGSMWYVAGKNNRTRKFYKKCIELTETMNPNLVDVCEIMSEVFYTLGCLSEKEENYREAGEYYKKGIENAEKLKNHPVSIFRVILAQLYHKMSMIIKYECRSLSTQFGNDKYGMIQKIFDNKVEESEIFHEKAITIGSAERDVNDMESFWGIGYRKSLDQIVIGKGMFGDNFKHFVYSTEDFLEKRDQSS